MGPVEKAIRRMGLVTLGTISKGAPFKVAEVSTNALVLVLGERWRTPISWSCLEGIPQFLGESCVKVNAGNTSRPAPDTLDGYLRAAGVQRRAGNYVAAVLVEAGIVETVPSRALRIRRPMRLRGYRSPSYGEN